MMNAKELVNSFLKQQELCLDKISQQTDLIIEIIDTLNKARNKGKKIFTMGNGGSA